MPCFISHKAHSKFTTLNLISEPEEHWKQGIAFSVSFNELNFVGFEQQFMRWQMTLFVYSDISDSLESPMHSLMA